MGLLFKIMTEFNCELHAWAVMANHYHVIVSTMETSAPFSKLFGKLHTLSAKELNAVDNKPGRKVWHQYWDSKITFEKSYYARLNYVNMNPAHHGVTQNVDAYPWCSSFWFKKEYPASYCQTIENFKFDLLDIKDDF